MSDGIDPLKDIFHVSDEEKKALQAAGSIIGVVSSVWGYVNTAKSVLTALGILSQSDPVATMRGYINQLALDFKGAIAALDAELSMRAVADHLNAARTQLLQLTELAPEDAATVGIDATWDAQRPFVLNDTLQTVLSLGDPAYWERVFFQELTYNKWGPHSTHPVPVVRALPGVPSGLVYDYRLVLPAYLEAVSIRLTILVAMVKNYHTAAIPELNVMIGTLESQFKKIRQSIYPVLWAPSNLSDTTDNPEGGVDTWIGEGARVGAVEIYSAADRAEAWPGAEYPVANFSPADIPDWEKFLVRYAVRNWVRWKQLYDIIGLNAVAAILFTLKRMTGADPVLPAPDVDAAVWEYDSRKIRDGNYSLWELARMIHDLSQYGQWGVFYLLTGPDGGLVDPLSLRDLLGLLQTFRGTPYTSFREALAQ
ncbi:MAG TPA: hypothetical protein VMT54_03790 [Candidatus Cybelea sp.]|nr:hypothetical protein [Candidatus Cybelea sp.]